MNVLEKSGCWSILFLMDTKALFRFASIVAVAQLVFAGAAVAETQFTGIAAGATYSAPVGEEYQTYSESTGYRAQFWAKNDAVLGDVFQLHGSAGYRPYDIRGLTSSAAISLKQWAFFLGFETGRMTNPSWIKPFFGIDFGAVFSDLEAPTGYAKNSAFHFASEVIPGFEIPIWGALSFQASAPLTFIFTNKVFISLSGEGSLRWSL